MQTLGEKLYAARKASNLSQDYVSRKLNVSRQTISKWENGTVQPNSKNVKALCEIYNIDSDYLYNENKVHCKEAVAEVAATRIKSDKSKYIKIGIAINAAILVCLIAVTTCIGFISMPKNKGDFLTSTENVDVSVFIILLCFACLSFALEVALTAFLIIKKHKRKQNVNRM